MHNWYEELRYDTSYFVRCDCECVFDNHVLDSSTKCVLILKPYSPGNLKIVKEPNIIAELYSYRDMPRTPANARLRTISFRTFCGAACTCVSSIAYVNMPNDLPWPNEK